MKKSDNKSVIKNSPFKAFVAIIEGIALIITIASCLFLGNCLKDKNRYDSEYKDKISYYYENGFDLMVSGASNEQIVGFDNNTNVTHMTKAVKLSLNVKTSNNNDYRNIIVFDSYNDLEFSEFTSKRLIKQVETNQDSVAVDFKFSQLYKVDAGDKMTITINGTEKNVTVSKIYRTDYFYPEGVIIATKDVFNINAKTYTAYLNSSNIEALKEELKTYKPMGTLLSQTSSQTDEDYQKYLDEFNSKDYYSTYIFDLNTQSADAFSIYTDNIKLSNSKFVLSIVVTSFVCFITSFGCFFINAKNKNDKIYKYIRDNGNKKIKLIFSLFNVSFIAIYTIGVLLTFGLSLGGLTVYYSFFNVLSNAYLSWLCPILSILVGYAITAIIIRKA